MNTKKIIILSLSSDIAYEIAKNFIKKKFKVFGTYRTLSDKIKNLKSKGAEIYKLDLSKKKEIDRVASKIGKTTFNEWDYFISCAGNLAPVREILRTKSDLWEKSVYINSIGQIRFLNKILNSRKKNKIKILFFSGSGTNGPKNKLSAYTLSKILLIKFVELLDSEERYLTTGILGPGYLNTKIHSKKNKTLKNNFSFKIKKIINFIEWFFRQPRKVVGGRNFSLEHDNWNSKQLKKVLFSNNDFYKLRRFGNNIKIK